MEGQITRRGIVWVVATLSIAALVATGCGSVAPTGDIDSLTEDSNENGFLDVSPPDGIEFQTVSNMKIRLANTISQDELGALAAEFGVDPSLLNLVDIVANIDVDLDYGAGISDTLTQSESIEPFDKKFEIACPDAIGVDVNVIANVPLVGPQAITDFVVDLAGGDEYECGQTIEVEVFVNESGNPDVNVDIH